VRRDVVRRTAYLLYATAWRRRRIRNRAASVVGIACAVVLAATAVYATAGRPGHGGSSPAGGVTNPSVRPSGPAPHSEAPLAQPGLADGAVEDVVATDPDHLYAVQHRCAPGKGAPCPAHLYGSDDGGRTWTLRSNLGPSAIDVPASGVIRAEFPAGNTDRPRFSTDGGRHRTDLRSAPGTVPEVPADGWATCQPDGLACPVYGVDRHSGVQRRLAKQPPITPAAVDEVPAGAGIWVSGIVPAVNRAALSVSRDNGGTWTTHVFGQDEADYPKDVADQSVGIATVDDTTAYAIVSIVTNDADNQMRVYRTTDGGQTWTRAQTGNTLPWVKQGQDSFVTADGQLVVQTAPAPAGWYIGTTGAYHNPVQVTGLGDAHDIWGSVRCDRPGTYTLVDLTAAYTSPDGLHWTRHTVRTS
jgi:hypothetical protein